jgi:hypothetical protein
VNFWYILTVINIGPDSPLILIKITALDVCYVRNTIQIFGTSPLVLIFLA